MTDTPDRVSSSSSANGKRTRRQRSYQGAAHYNNGHTGKKGTVQPKKKVEYHDKRNDVPMFLKKTYALITQCSDKDHEIASWTDCGTMFVIKDQDRFAEEIIPQFFDHKKFSSFARQLNFYGFRKIQNKTVYKEDFNEITSKYVTFCNEKFQRGKEELLKDIQRSTKGNQNNPSFKELQNEVEVLKDRVKELEFMNEDYKIRFAQIETHLQQFLTYQGGMSPGLGYGDLRDNYEGKDTVYGPVNGNYTNQVNQNNHNYASKATLPPHPSAKALPENQIVPPPLVTNNRQESFDKNFLRGYSQYDLLTEEQLTPFEKKFFTSTLSKTDLAEKPDTNREVERQVSNQFKSFNLNDFPLLGSGDN